MPEIDDPNAHQQTDAPPIDEQPQFAVNSSSIAIPTETQSLESQSIEHRSVESQSIEHQSIEAQSIEAQSIEAQSIEAQSIEAQTMDLPMDFSQLPEQSEQPLRVRQLFERISTEMRKTLVGQENLVEMLVVAILAGGHVLLEGVPGTAKTLAIRTMARVFDVSFARIQFTPDLMPSDILGTSVYDPRTQQFNLKTGPIFAGLVLADEVNRTPPKTQAALLEAMEERRVTIDGIPHPLPFPFMVCATQNPIEFEGTYPLPEAQLDRFMLKILVPYPSAEEEQNILARVQAGFRAQKLDEIDIVPALTETDLPLYQAEVERIYCRLEVQQYIVNIVRATRASRHLVLGASPRAAITLLLTSKALAALRGDKSVTPDHVKYMLGAVLRHRLALRPESEIEGYTPDRVLESVIESVPVPL